MNDSSLNATDPIVLPGVQATFIVFYTVIFVLGICGNSLICYVVYHNHAMQTVTNFFITNLALSDILLCALSVPFTAPYTFIGEWLFGSILCHTVPYAQGVSVYISTWTLTSIAVDRFFVIIYPFRPRMLIRTCFFIILSTWAFSILVTSPYAIYMTHGMHNNTTVCEEKWPVGENNDYRITFGCLTMALQFIVPFIIISFCYIKVSLKLNDRARSKPGAKNSRKEEMDRERKRRTNRMLIAMVFIFGLSWLPLNCINVLNDFHEGIGHSSYYNLCFFIAHVLAMSSTCYNPFLYAWLNENFRKEFKQILPGLWPSSSNSTDRVGGWKSERTCNGNDTVQETLLQSTSMIRRCSSIRIQLAEATKPADPAVSYSSGKERVELHLSDDSHLLQGQSDGSKSSPPRERGDSETAELV